VHRSDHPEAAVSRIDRPWSYRVVRGRPRTIEQSVTRRQGIGATSLTFLERSQFLPRLRVSEPALVFVRHGQKLVMWDDDRVVIPADAGVAIAAGQTLNVVNRPSREGIYEEVWLSGDRAILTSWRAADREPVTAVAPIPAPPPELRAAFDRAVEAITARNAVPYAMARRCIVEVMRSVGLARGLNVPPASLC
jgi:hypothetical protein